MRLKALQIALSAKLFEGRIVMVDSEHTPFAKTKYLDEVMKPFFTDRLAMVTGFDPCPNFSTAAKNIKNLSVFNPQQIHVPQLVWSDIIFMTREGLEQLEIVMEGRTTNAFRNRTVPLEEPSAYRQFIGEYKSKKNQHPAYEQIIAPTQEELAEVEEGELELFTPSLQSYLQELEKVQQ
uniref:Uncharacterized protein n=1 Tax=Strombidium inclinatum TaxID=197538 RepID=A0A7S3IXP3_9SPIT|mmetsp:Transcript_8186/g.12549  ORF Transcript_8186/g.12549 Transcript_8186/m.12549 type:complete len:179 (+) Transcript_8186:515-1051(+)